MLDFQPVGFDLEKSLVAREFFRRRRPGGSGSRSAALASIFSD